MMIGMCCSDGASDSWLRVCVAVSLLQLAQIHASEGA